jgi:hypothetical protein
VLCGCGKYRPHNTIRQRRVLKRAFYAYEFSLSAGFSFDTRDCNSEFSQYFRHAIFGLPQAASSDYSADTVAQMPVPYRDTLGV